VKRLYDAKTASCLRIRRKWWMGLYRYTRGRWHILFAFVDALGWSVFGPIRLLQSWRQNPSHDPRSILLVQLDHLGDAVMSLGLIRCLSRRYPAARLEVLCGARNRELFAACPIVDVLHVMRVTRFSRQKGFTWTVELLRFGWRMRRRKFDVAIDVRGEFPHAVLLWLSGARRRIGWSSGGGGFLLTDRLRHVPGRHEVRSRAGLLSALGISASASDLSPQFEPAADALREVGKRLAAESRPGCGQGPLVVLHVGAGTPAKRWPLAHWRELAARLIVEFDARIVLVGNDDDRAMAWRHVVDWTGRLRLGQLAALLRVADLFVGADSGPAHLAAAVGTPVIALFSGTNDPRQWRPWGAHVSVVRHPPACSPCHREECPWADRPCMKALLPEAVLGHIRKVLSPRFRCYPVSAHSMEGDPDGAADRAAHAAAEPRSGTVAA
jgi:lipopolysaccharide heptosyltransferase II